MTWLAIITFILIVCIMGYAAYKEMLEWVEVGIIVGFLILLLSIALFTHVPYPEQILCQSMSIVVIQHCK